MLKAIRNPENNKSALTQYDNVLARALPPPARVPERQVTFIFKYTLPIVCPVEAVKYQKYTVKSIKNVIKLLPAVPYKQKLNRIS